MLSIITPVLNGAKYIVNNIESIQKLKIPYEHIIVDGGSVDGTLELINNFPGIKLLHQKDKLGMYAAIHQGFMEAKGQYLCWVNSDDIVIAKGYEIMYISGKNNKADFLYSHGILHFTEEHYYKNKFACYYTRYLLGIGVFPFVQSSVMFSKKSYFIVGGLQYDKFRLIGDRDLFQRMALNDKVTFLFVPVFSSIFLMYNGSLLYRNLDNIKTEYQYCRSSKVNWFHRVIFHASQFLRSLVWVVFKK